MIDVSESFEASNGFTIIDTNPDNSEGPFVTGGSSTPIGLDLPQRTLYIQQTSNGVDLWRKYGLAVNEWEIVTNNSLPVAFEEFTDLSQDNTTNNNWRTTFQDTSQVNDPGLYYIGVSVQGTNSDKEKQFGFRVQARSGTSGSWATQAPLNVLETVGQDGAFKIISGFAIYNHLVSDVIQFRIQHGQTDEGGTSRQKNKKVIIYKVE